jgi:hypothetical protein
MPDSDRELVKFCIVSMSRQKPVNVSSLHLELLREPDDAPGLGS